MRAKTFLARIDARSLIVPALAMLARLLLLAAASGSSLAQGPGYLRNELQPRSNAYLKSALQAAIDFPTPQSTIDRSTTPFTVITATVVSEQPIEAAIIHVCDSSDGTACSYAYSSLAEFPLDPDGPFQAIWSPAPDRIPFETSVQFIAWITVREVNGQSISSLPVSFHYIISDKRTVRLVAPEAETGLLSPATVLLLGSYSPKPGDTAGVDHMEFLDGSTPIGSLSTPNATPPGYALLWKNPPPGAHAITVRAVDATGKTMSSAPSSIYVIPPDGAIDVALELPRTGEAFAVDAPIPLRATAASAGGSIERVEFVDGTVILATLFEPPFETTWQSPSIGIHAISARAYDDLGFATASAAAYVETADAPRRPQVVLTSPRSGTVAKLGTAIAYEAQVDAPDAAVSRVEFRSDGNLIASIASAPFKFDWTPPSTGNHQASASVIDTARYSGTSQPIFYAVTADGNPPADGTSTGLPPTVELVSPVAGASFTAGSTINFRVNASGGDSTLMRVDYLANGITVASATTPPWNADWIGAPQGTYVAAAKASTYQHSGAVSQSISISVTAPAPSGVSIEMASQAPGAVFYPGDALELRPAQMQLSGGVAHIDYYVDGVLAGSTNLAPYTVEWDATLPGVHVVVARVYDTAGNDAQSSPVEIKVTPLAVTITSPIAGAQIQAKSTFVEGTYAGPANTGITVNGLVAVVDGHGHFFINDLSVPAGQAKLNAIATSIGGSRTSFSLNVTGSSDSAAPLPNVAASEVEGVDSLTMHLTATDFQDVDHWRIIGANGTVMAQGAQANGDLATIQYPAPGLYRQTIEITDKSQHVILKNLSTLVWSSADVASTRMSVVNRFLDALRREQREKALDALTSGVSERFVGIYDALRGHWADILASIAPPGGITFGIDAFEAATTRERSGQRFLYLIEGVRDSDGVWRIDSF